jgi:hypothetical protein
MPDANGWDTEETAPAATPEPAKEVKPVSTSEAVVQNPPGAGRSASQPVYPVEDEGSEEWPQYQVQPPLSEFSWHGVVVTTEPTSVNPLMVGPLLSAAREVGAEVTLVEE